MFRSHKEFEVDMPLPVELYGENPGMQHWAGFEILFNEVWFLVEILAAEGGGKDAMKMITNYCFTDFNAVLQLVAMEGVLEHRVNAVLPTYLDVERKFSIKPLAEFFTAKERGQQSMKIYVANDGTRYVESALGLSEAEAEEKTLIYANRRVANFNRAN
jgi:hypothetical protein